MQQVIIVIHLMVVVALVALVLYQKSEGGALGIGGGGFFTGRGQANALTRATGVLAAIFFLTSIALTVLPAWERGPGQAFEEKLEIKEIPAPSSAPPAQAPATDGKESVFDQLMRAQEKRRGAPQAPAAPAQAQKPAAAAPEAPAATEPAGKQPTEAAPTAAPPAAPPAPAANTTAPSEPAAKPPAEAPKNSPGD
ncbi:MAG: preprotein translocase subunit SecG [Methylocystis sp.]|nr:preprotein translocase subunit SecG [Methylocystis sp.]